MTAIKVVLILAVLGLLVLLVRHHGTNRTGAYTKIGMALFLVFAIYAVIRPGDVSWVADQLGVGRGTDLVLYLLVVGFGYFAISTYLRFKELELKFARLARVLALVEAAQREHERHCPVPVRPSVAQAGAIDGAAAGRAVQSVGEHTVVASEHSDRSELAYQSEH